VHQRSKGVSTLPFCVVVRVKGVVKEAIRDELMPSSFGRGKMNCAWLDRVQIGGGTGLGQLYPGRGEGGSGMAMSLGMSGGAGSGT
jgi:hypothetical protein